MSDHILDHAAVMSDYAAAPQRLVELVASLDGSALNRSLHADSWTIRQLVHHILRWNCSGPIGDPSHNYWRGMGSRHHDPLGRP